MAEAAKKMDATETPAETVSGGHLVAKALKNEGVDDVHVNEITENLFIHMRSIRMRTIAEDHRASRSIIDHMNIIEALEQRDTELAERLARQHTLDLGAHVEKNVDYLD